jgi:hypothetical protein
VEEGGVEGGGGIVVAAEAQQHAGAGQVGSGGAWVGVEVAVERGEGGAVVAAGTERVNSSQAIGTARHVAAFLTLLSCGIGLLFRSRGPRTETRG